MQLTGEMSSKTSTASSPASPSPLLSGLSQHRDVFFMFPGDALKASTSREGGGEKEKETEKKEEEEEEEEVVMMMEEEVVVAVLAEKDEELGWGREEEQVEPRAWLRRCPSRRTPADPAVLESTRVAGLKGDDGGETKAFCYFRVFPALRINRIDDTAGRDEEQGQGAKDQNFTR
eukprot:767211-Hanusia_phi.AAC.1